MNTHVMDKNIGETRLDRATQGVIGKPLDRFEGPLKVSGRAPYAYEHLLDEKEIGYGFVVTAGIGKGKITGIDESAAKAAPGVLAVVSGDKILRSLGPADEPGGPDGRRRGLPLRPAGRGGRRDELRGRAPCGQAGQGHPISRRTAASTSTR